MYAKKKYIYIYRKQNGATCRQHKLVINNTIFQSLCRKSLPVRLGHKYRKSMFGHDWIVFLLRNYFISHVVCIGGPCSGWCVNTLNRQLFLFPMHRCEKMRGAVDPRPIGMMPYGLVGPHGPMGYMGPWPLGPHGCMGPMGHGTPWGPMGPCAPCAHAAHGPWGPWVHAAHGAPWAYGPMGAHGPTCPRGPMGPHGHMRPLRS